MRLDLWLWAVRVFKTRGNAVTAIRSGLVLVNGLAAKPSREVRPGDIVTARVGDLTRTLRAKASPRSRVGAALVPDHADDLTPESEYERHRNRPTETVAFREKGLGRPTKRDRRRIEEFTG